jgi:hypothetical protein
MAKNWELVVSFYSNDANLKRFGSEAVQGIEVTL